MKNGNKNETKVKKQKTQNRIMNKMNVENTGNKFKNKKNVSFHKMIRDLRPDLLEGIIYMLPRFYPFEIVS